MLSTVMQIKLVVVILDCGDGLSSVEGEDGVRGTLGWVTFGLLSGRQMFQRKIDNQN